MEPRDDDLYWHWLRPDGRLGRGDGRLVLAGETLSVPGPPRLCYWGLHASRRAIDALHYATGSVVCRVRLGGDVVHDHDKSVATSRTVLWMADATSALLGFANRLVQDMADACHQTPSHTLGIASSVSVERARLVIADHVVAIGDEEGIERLLTEALEALAPAPSTPRDAVG